jgi:hypothetical protein
MSVIRWIRHKDGNIIRHHIKLLKKWNKTHFIESTGSRGKGKGYGNVWTSPEVAYRDDPHAIREFYSRAGIKIPKRAKVVIEEYYEAEAERRAYEEEIAEREAERAVKNKNIVITLYKYETNDKRGRTLELDIVASMIVSNEEYENIKKVDELMASFIHANLKRTGYDGLAVASEYEENKYGIQIEDTDEGVKSFSFDRFVINGSDYTDSVNRGDSNITTKEEREARKQKKV